MHTVASPHFSQMATALARLLAELHHIATRGLWSDGNLCQSLLTITQIHSQNHLKDKVKKTNTSLMHAGLLGKEEF